MKALAVTERISLVPRHPSDALEMFGVIDAHRDDLRTWLPWVDATRSLMDVKRHAQFLERQTAQAQAYDFAIREDGRIVGAAGIHAIDQVALNARVGYFLIPPARGRGVMHLVARFLTDAGFNQLGLHRLEIRVVRENERSRAVAEKLGYRYEGMLQEAEILHGRFRDVALYATIAPRWQAEQRADSLP